MPRATESCQPDTAMRPSRTSAPRIIFAPNFLSQVSSRSGRRAATLPMMACVAPASKAACTDDSSESPPPHSISQDTALAMASSVARFFGAPALAPSRSTRWMRWTPQSA